MRTESSPAGMPRTEVPDRQAGLRRDISELSAVLGRTLVRQRNRRWNAQHGVTARPGLGVSDLVL
jgi:hypothetical protein